MFTLKLASYNQFEVNTLAASLSKMKKDIETTFCGSGFKCSTCPARHLCIDLAQAELYASEYTAIRK